MAEESRKKRGAGGIGEGLRSGIGILNAFKEAIEETIQEAVDRGDLSPDRAKRAMRDAADRVQNAFDEVRDRVEFVPRKEFEELRAEVSDLRGRLAALEAKDGEGGAGGGIVVEAE